MAKPHVTKQPPKAEIANTSADDVTVGTGPESTAKEEASKPAASASPNSLKKDSARPKKQSSVKNGSLLPSAYKLEQLKAAVSAAGNAEQLLLILNHVEEAGGRAEVIESIEAYRVLKTVLED